MGLTDNQIERLFTILDRIDGSNCDIAQAIGDSPTSVPTTGYSSGVQTVQNPSGTASFATPDQVESSQYRLLLIDTTSDTSPQFDVTVELTDGSSWTHTTIGSSGYYINLKPNQAPIKKVTVTESIDTITNVVINLLSSQ